MFNPLVAAQEKTVEPKACSYGKAGVLLGTAEAEAGRMTEIVSDRMQRGMTAKELTDV
jgi:hypothetical protein